MRFAEVLLGRWGAGTHLSVKSTVASPVGIMVRPRGTDTMACSPCDASWEPCTPLPTRVCMQHPQTHLRPCSFRFWIPHAADSTTTTAASTPATATASVDATCKDIVKWVSGNVTHLDCAVGSEDPDHSDPVVSTVAEEQAVAGAQGEVLRAAELSGGGWAIPIEACRPQQHDKLDVHTCHLSCVPAEALCSLAQSCTLTTCAVASNVGDDTSGGVDEANSVVATVSEHQARLQRHTTATHSTGSHHITCQVSRCF